MKWGLIAIGVLYLCGFLFTYALEWPWSNRSWKHRLIDAASWPLLAPFLGMCYGAMAWKERRKWRCWLGNHTPLIRADMRYRIPIYEVTIRDTVFKRAERNVTIGLTKCAVCGHPLMVEGAVTRVLSPGEAASMQASLDRGGHLEGHLGQGEI